MSSIETPAQNDDRQASMRSRSLIGWLCYGQAALAVISILVHWGLTGRLHLNLNFLLLIWCGYAVAHGSRAAVKWGFLLIGYYLVASGLVLCAVLFNPTALHSGDEPLTPFRVGMALAVGIEVLLWSSFTWSRLCAVRQHEQIVFRIGFDWRMIAKVSLLLGLIFVMIYGLMQLDRPDAPPPADQLPITNSQDEQLVLLRDRYDRQLEYLKEITLHPELRHQIPHIEQQEELFDREPGIVNAEVEVLSRDGRLSFMHGLGTHEKSLSLKTFPGGYPTGTVTLASGERYHVIDYSDFVRNEAGVWLKYELLVRQDHLQESEPDFE